MRKIFIYDNEYDCIGIGGLSVSNIQWQLADANGEDIEVHISSGGGSAFDGLAIYNLLASYPGKVTTVNDALAGSAAAIILMAANERKSAQYTLMMIHNASCYAGDGTAKELDRTQEMLAAVDSQIAAIYSDKTGLPLKSIIKMLEAETWMTPDVALASGFITEILTDESALVTNSAQIQRISTKAPTIYQSIFNKILTQNDPNMADHKEQIEKNTSLMAKVMNFMKKFIKNEAGIYAADFAVGNAAYSDEDLEMPAPDNTYVKDKKKITVKDGLITNMDIDEEEIDSDEDDIENIVTNKTPYKVENHAKVINHLTDVTNRLKVAETGLVENTALLNEARTELSKSQALLKRTDEEVRNTIKSEFEPDGSKRSARSTATAQVNAVVSKKEDLLEDVMPKSDLAQNMLKRSK